MPDKSAEDARLFLNRESLIQHCKQFLPKSPRIAEVGVYRGLFSEYLLEALCPSEMHLIDTFSVCDDHENEFTPDTHYPYILKKIGSRKGLHVHQGLSWDMRSLLPDDSLDFIYIDADHHYEPVKRDNEAAVKKLKHNGIMQFNDCTHCSEFHGERLGVLKAVTEFLLGYGAFIRILGLSLDVWGYHDFAVSVQKDTHNNRDTMAFSEVGHHYTDKLTVHSYGPFYDILFLTYKDSAYQVVEIGILAGSFLSAIADYLPQARIQGVDISGWSRPGRAQQGQGGDGVAGQEAPQVAPGGVGLMAVPALPHDARHVR